MLLIRSDIPILFFNTQRQNITAKNRTLDLRRNISLLTYKEEYYLEIRFRTIKVRVSRLVERYVTLLSTEHYLIQLRESVRLFKLHLN